MTRRWAALVLAALAARGGDDGPVNFIHLSDTHVADLDGVSPELALARSHLHDAATRLGDFLDALSAPETGPYRPAFFLITGDLVDAFRYAGADGRKIHGQVERFRKAAAKSRVPVYVALGNHDLVEVAPAGASAWAAAARAAWSASEPCLGQGTWYTFERSVGRTSYRFVVLDNGGEPVPEQERWLRAQRFPGEVVIVALHVPLGGEAESGWIRAALAKARVALVLAGHTHGNAIRAVALGSAGAVEVRTGVFSPAGANWRRVRLLEDRIEVFAPGELDAVEKVVPLIRSAAR